MFAYVTRLSDQWHCFILSPNQIWIELQAYDNTKEGAEKWLKGLGFTVVDEESRDQHKKW